MIDQCNRQSCDDHPQRSTHQFEFSTFFRFDDAFAVIDKLWKEAMEKTYKTAEQFLKTAEKSAVEAVRADKTLTPDELVRALLQPSPRRVDGTGAVSSPRTPSSLSATWPNEASTASSATRSTSKSISSPTPSAISSPNHTPTASPRTIDSSSLPVDSPRYGAYRSLSSGKKVFNARKNQLHQKRFRLPATEMLFESSPFSARLWRRDQYFEVRSINLYRSINQSMWHLPSANLLHSFTHSHRRDSLNVNRVNSICLRTSVASIHKETSHH